MAGDCCPYIVQYIAIGHDVNHFSQRNLRNGDPNFGSTEDFSRHSSGEDLISLGEGVSYDGPLGALRDSEGRDNYASSLDRTTARILSRNLKRDIFAPRRGRCVWWGVFPKSRLPVYLPLFECTAFRNIYQYWQLLHTFPQVHCSARLL